MAKTLIYDGDCGFCRRWVERVRRWDRRDALKKLGMGGATVVGASMIVSSPAFANPGTPADIATAVSGQVEAIAHLSQEAVDIIILDLVIEEGSALAISDYANYRQPAARVIFVTNTSFFSNSP